TTLSLGHFVVFGIPSLLGGWYASNKQWLGTLLLLVLMGGAFYLIKGNVSETGEPWQGPSVANPASYGGYAASDPKVEESGRKVGRPRPRPPHSLWSPKDRASDAVIHVELDRVRHHLEPLNLFHL